MALIGKIRDKSVLLVIVIFVALMAFVLGDWQSFSRGGGDEIGYGTIAGDPVDGNAYLEAAENFENNDKQNAAQQGRPYTQQDADASADKAWSYIVETNVLNREIEALGLAVGAQELDAYLYARDGFAPLPDLAQNFSDSLGRFDAKALAQRIEQMENSEDPQARKSWEDSKNYYIERRKQEKYFALISQGVYVTKAEAEEEYIAQKESKSIRLVLKRYSDLSDEEIKVTDEEMKAYYNEHKNDKKYEQKFDSRKVKYFDVRVDPSDEDVKNFNKEMEALKAQFAATDNDSMFVMKNSNPDFRFFSSSHQATFLPLGNEKARQGLTYPSTMDSVFASAPVGTVVGPYKDGENTRIAKILDYNTKTLKVRHILLSAQREDTAKVDQVRKTADSLLALINKNNFDEYVVKYSEDPGSKDKGGVYEDFFDFEMVPEFSKFASDEPIGKIGVVQTIHGFHIMEVLDRTAVRYPVLAVVQKTLKASPATIAQKESEIYDLLYKLDGGMKGIEDNAKKIEKFDTIVQKAGYFSREITINGNKPVVYGYNTKLAEDKLIKMAFDEDVQVGTLVGSPIKDKDRYIIAVVSGVRAAGAPSFEDIKDAIKFELVKEGKAKRFIAQMNGAKSVDELAKKLNIAPVDAEVTFSSPQINAVGFEPEIIGAVFSGLKDGQKTVPLMGRNGVYVVQVKKTTKAPATSNYTEQKAALTQTAKGSAPNTAKAALMEKANIVDNRRFLKIGIRR